jgi:predicted GNAT superfamily acetyltransferase
MTSDDVRIRYEPATSEDHSDILALNEDAIPAVNRIDVFELRQLHDQSEALIVARRSGNLAGFLLALNETADYSSPNFQFFKRNFDEFVYVDRIVVDPGHRRMGIGADLYRALFASALHSRVTCEVNVRPPNPGSLAFHRDLGFEVVDEQDTEGGAKRVALMVRAPP